jgi:hypothetical protein
MLFCPMAKKSSCHRIIKRTPYKALFGVDFPVGLLSTDLPTETVREITTEEDLEKVLTNITEGEEVYFEHLITKSSQISQETNHSGDEEVFELNDTPTTPKNSTDIEEIQIFNVVDILIVDQTIVEINSPIVDQTRIKINGNASNKTVHCEKCLKNLTQNERMECDLCQKETIQTRRMGCIVGQKRAADKTLETTKQKLKPLTLGQNIAIEVPKFDREPLDPKNILGTIVEIKNGVHRIGTIHGMLNRWFSRDEIIGIETSEPIHVLEEKIITLREAVTKFSKFGG